MKLIEQLIALGKETEDNIDHLNAGGCGVYAAYVARRLQRLGVPAWGVAADSYRLENVDEVRLRERPRSVFDWNNAGVGFNHVLVQFVHGGRIWTHDSGTTTDKRLNRDPRFGFPFAEGALTTAELRAIANDPDGWNDAFDRETGIPAIKANVAKYLKPRAIL